MKIYPITHSRCRYFFREYLPEFIFPRDSNIPVLLSVIDDRMEVVGACIAFRTKLFDYDPTTLRVEVCCTISNFQYSILFGPVWKASFYLGYDRLIYYGHAEQGAQFSGWYRKSQGRFVWFEKSSRTVREGPDMPFKPNYKERERKRVIIPENETIEPRQKKLF